MLVKGFGSVCCHLCPHCSLMKTGGSGFALGLLSAEMPVSSGLLSYSVAPATGCDGPVVRILVWDPSMPSPVCPEPRLSAH